MNKSKVIRHTNYATQKLINFYKQNWFYLWLFFIISIIGFIFGVVSVYKYADSITTSNMIDTKFLEFLSKECSSFGLTISYFFKFLFYSIVFLCLCSNRYLSFLCFIIIAYSGFCMGINTSIIVITFKFSGILHVCLCYVPFYLLETILLAVIFCTFLMRLICCNKICNKSYLAFDKEFLSQILFFLLVGFLLFFVQSLVNSLTTSTIIVVI